MNAAAVIFDMDGVIVDSEPRHERAFLEVVKEIGFEEKHGLRFADYVGRSDQELWRDFVARNRPSQSLKDLLEMWEPLEADNHEYVLELRAKLRAANNQLEAMCGT